MDKTFCEKSEEDLKEWLNAQCNETGHSLSSPSTPFVLEGVNTVPDESKLNWNFKSYKDSIKQPLSSLDGLSFRSSDDFQINQSPVALYKSFYTDVGIVEIYDENNKAKKSFTIYGIDEVDFRLPSFIKSNSNIANDNASLNVSVIGNKGAGKTSLVQALLSKIGIANYQNKANEANGIMVNTLLTEKGDLKIYDLACDLDSFECFNIFMADNSIYLICFDVKEFAVCTEKVDADSIIEKWFQLISEKAPNSKVIIVATNIDNHAVNNSFLKEVWRTIKGILDKNKERHDKQFPRQKLHHCLLCQEKELCRVTDGEMVGSVFIDDALAGTYRRLDSNNILDNDGNRLVPGFPHVVGYFEVSSIYHLPQKFGLFQNKCIKKLRESLLLVAQEMLVSVSSVSDRWRFIKERVLNANKDIICFENFYQHVKISENFTKDELSTILSFYHTQGELLFFNSKESSHKFIIPNIAWLISTLRKLSVFEDTSQNVVKGFITMNTFRNLFKNMSFEEYKNVSSLLKESGYIIQVNSEKIMIPNNLPVGIPNLDQWPLNHDEKQISFLFCFDYLPGRFFPSLISHIDRSYSGFFTGKMKPLYTKSNIVYNTTLCGKTCEEHLFNDPTMTSFDGKTAEKGNIRITGQTQRHRINIKLLQEKYQIILSVVGPSPCCVANNVIESLTKFQKKNFHDTVMDYHILCGICVNKCHTDPCYFTNTDMKSMTPICERGHDLKSWKHVKHGISKLGQDISVRKIVDALEDTECPKLFLITRINKEILSLPKFIKTKYFYSSYTVHLLCEHPDSWHIVGPSYELKSPKEFFKKHGKRIQSMLRLLSHLKTPFRLSIFGGPIANALQEVGEIADKTKQLLYDVKNEHSCCRNLGQSDCLKYLSSNDNLSRRELKYFLNALDEKRKFGDLLPTFIGDRIRWLCREHSSRYQPFEFIRS